VVVGDSGISNFVSLLPLFVTPSAGVFLGIPLLDEGMPYFQLTTFAPPEPMSRTPVTDFGFKFWMEGVLGS
jgi:hypothetical protein